MRLLLILTLLALAGCAIERAPQNTTIQLPNADFSIEGVEGERISLNPQAQDPDDDVITYRYELPFDARGQWQTQLGDEGVHYTTITADDGRGGTAIASVRVTIYHKNRAPIIECTPSQLKELETINLLTSCRITDVENDTLKITYAGWFTTPTYTTTHADAGEHTITIIADDGNDTATYDFTMHVANVNRPPIFESFPDEITATEGDIIALQHGRISDPDGDALTITFSAPFDNQGMWESELGDAGTYNVSIVASDGTDTTTHSTLVRLVLRNTAPTLKPIEDIIVNEGEIVRIPISATDREGDALTMVISGWMNTHEYTTTYEDAGTYTVHVAISDGKEQAERTVSVTVLDRNRPPYFVTPA